MARSQTRSIPALAAALVLGAVTLLGFAAPLLPPELAGGLTATLDRIGAAPWAPAAAVAVYVGLATLGVPQIVLVTALVLAFDGWGGFLLSLAGKVLACAVGFAIGRRFGTAILAKRQSPELAAFMARLAKNGFAVSLAIRLVPSVPSVLINIAAGATPIRFIDFMAGTALGSVPKMALYAFGGHAAIVAVRDNDLAAWAGLAFVGLIWAAMAWTAHRWVKEARAEARAAAPQAGA